MNKTYEYFFSRNDLFLRILITELHTRKMYNFIENKFFIKFLILFMLTKKLTLRVSTKLSKFCFLLNIQRF